MPEVCLTQPAARRDSRRLLAFCLDAGVDCFSVTRMTSSDGRRRRANEAVFRRLEPFRLGTRRLEQTVVYRATPRSRDDWYADVECWRFDRDSATAVLAACRGSLTHYAFGGPEDWKFYRDGRLFLGTVSHERFAFLRLRDDDVEAFDRLGLEYSLR